MIYKEPNRRTALEKLHYKQFEKVISNAVFGTNDWDFNPVYKYKQAYNYYQEPEQKTPKFYGDVKFEDGPDKYYSTPIGKYMEIEKPKAEDFIYG